MNLKIFGKLKKSISLNFVILGECLFFLSWKVYWGDNQERMHEIEKKKFMYVEVFHLGVWLWLTVNIKIWNLSMIESVKPESLEQESHNDVHIMVTHLRETTQPKNQLPIKMFSCTCKKEKWFSYWASWPSYWLGLASLLG